MIQKSRPRLLVAGIVLLAGPGLAYVSAWLWVPGILAGLTGGYLIYWAAGAASARPCPR